MFADIFLTASVVVWILIDTAICNALPHWMHTGDVPLSIWPSILFTIPYVALVMQVSSIIAGGH